MKFKRLVVGLAAIAAVAASSIAQAQQYPDKPITLIVPWSARVLAKAAEAYLGQPIIVVNRPGASTTIGMGELAKAKPDGYTIGTLSSTAYLVSLQGRQLPFDPIQDFSYISYYGDNLIGIAVLQDSPYKKLSDLLDFAKANPGKLKNGGCRHDAAFDDRSASA